MNFFRFETLRGDVVLHFKHKVDSFMMGEIKMVTITPGDTSVMTENTMLFSIMSEQFIPGGSRIEMLAPTGFAFRCDKPYEVFGLSQTTICPTAQRSNTARFILDSQNALGANHPFSLQVVVENPEYTPQPNKWTFSIITVLDEFIDVRYDVRGFFVTGPITVRGFLEEGSAEGAIASGIQPGFVFLGQKNAVKIVFRPTTIMNQADSYNEIVLTAPKGYVFPTICNRFRLALADRDPPKEGEPPLEPINYYKQNGKEVPFPEPRTQCIGFGNNSVIVRFPPGTGLLWNDYIMVVEVINPKLPIIENCTNLVADAKNTWTLITRVNMQANGTKIVDANRNINGFCIQELQKVKDLDLDGAASRFCVGMILFFVLW